MATDSAALAGQKPEDTPALRHEHTRRGACGPQRVQEPVAPLPPQNKSTGACASPRGPAITGQGVTGSE